MGCGKGIDFDVGGTLQRESNGCEAIVRQTDEPTGICSMSYAYDVNTVYLCPLPRHTTPNLGRWDAVT